MTEPTTDVKKAELILKGHCAECFLINMHNTTCSQHPWAGLIKYAKEDHEVLFGKPK